MTAPRTPRYLVELLPVAFLPGLHTVLALLRSFFVPFVLTAHLLPVVCFYSLLTSSIRPWMRRVLKGSPYACLHPATVTSPCATAETIRHICVCGPSSSAGVSNTSRGLKLRRGAPA